MRISRDAHDTPPRRGFSTLVLFIDIVTLFVWESPYFFRGCIQCRSLASCEFVEDVHVGRTKLLP